MCIRDSYIGKRLKLEDILFARAMGDYVKLHSPNKFYVIQGLLKALEERLPVVKFIRVNRYYIAGMGKMCAML